jgi:histidinol dehydrogenase
LINIFNLSQIPSKILRNLMQRNPPMQISSKGVFDRDVASILKQVKAKGDLAVQRLNQKWSKKKADPLFYREVDFVSALSAIPVDVKDSLINAAREIRTFHKRQIRKDIKCKIRGRELGRRFLPHERVAVYVPGGKALYPSTVLMGVIPAKLAGVKNIIILSPPGPTGRVNDYVLAAAALTEANGLYAAGGAQAVAAACYGTQTLKPVSMIIGPGNNYVMRAKWQLSLQENLAIDSPAGPSEVLIIAEDVVPPEWVAADLLSQAEHGEDSPAILVTTDRNFGQRVKEALSKRLAENTPRNKIKSKAIDSSGSILVVNTLDEAIDFANRFAPEHLQIMTRKDSYVLSKITRAGSVFVGPYSPVAAGDYASGTNHILPTSGLAGIYSGLSVDTFYRTFTYQKLSKKGLARIAPTIRVLSQVEGLDEEHGRSVELRLR